MDEVYYPRVESVIQPEPIPADILATDFYQSTRVNLEQAQNAGFTTRIVNLGIDWDVVRDEIAGNKVPSAIAGQSWYGLNSGAKKSVDQNYLALAEATGFVTILPLHVVTEISERGRSGLYVVSVDHITEQGDVVAHEQLTTRHLFLAAGSVGTTKLLVRAKAKRTLRGLNDQVGLNWAGNGDFSVGRVGLPIDTPGTGGPAGHFIMEDFPPSNPSGPSSMIELVTAQHLAQAYQAQPIDGLRGISSYIGMGLHQLLLGSLTYDPFTDEVNVNFPSLFSVGMAPFLASAQHLLDTLNKANPPSITQSFAPFLTAHPCGGVVVGKACDEFGRVRGHRGLYVVDGALIPGFAGAVNPSLTIAAIAERCVERIIAEDILG